ncbi:MAG: hypothetical protein DWQ34_03490 [Planctomycetota bacterium]|nr:MAG: hypothetical protein DWQ29_09655 [Planctomycetota bacterium]REJ96600.1 MAG: hypothetical protein DWQ34_03490 [Planctomycetota bacterium]REK24740.1 MAG: hypothetical protein DWQ41_13470 [Planctomycetota bacterium]REK37821.1 MAG: hypothetical protein DWQ45_05955 [Planctomycetota bacterium]
MSESIGHVIREMTGGRPFVFVVMGYNEKAAFYQDAIRNTVEQETDLICIRADDVPGAGHDLLDKIHRMIESAELVVAEISSDSKNVFYEIGFAIGRNRPLLLLADNVVEIPTDLKGRELIRYVETAGGLRQFKDEFRRQLRSRVGSRLALLRDMLQADSQTPAYIAASPRRVSVEDQQRQNLGSQYHHRTFGDYLGIRGLLGAFGSLMGESSTAELISAQFVPPGLKDADVNLYLIGSKKVNSFAGQFLEDLQWPHEPLWYLGKLPEGDVKGQYVFDDRRHDLEQGLNFHCELYRRRGEVYFPQPSTMGKLADGTPYHRHDHGILVRAPHPNHSERIVLIMAGAHSLGSGAACIAATNSQKIDEIQSLLRARHDVNLADKSCAFWALVEGNSNDRDGSLDETGVKVVDVGLLKTPAARPRAASPAHLAGS